MYFADALTLDAPRRTSDGYLAVRARAARTGVYQYAGYEIDPDNKHGLRDQSSVNVLRDEATVFDERAVRTFIGKPITIDHPRESVNASNWKDHARGTVMGALRDGDHLAFDLLLMDSAAIAAVDGGKAQLSNGYAAEIQFGDFQHADGTKCQARQSVISNGNHVALVDNARGGSTCRIGDVAPCEPISITKLLDSYGDAPVKKIMLDGLQVDLSDAAAVEVAFTKLQKQVTDAVAALTAKDTELAAKDAQIDDLKGKVLDDAALDTLVAGRSNLIATAKLIAADIKTDGLSDADIRKAAVVAKLGDAAVKDKAAAYIDARFDILAEDAAKDKKSDPVRDAISGGLRTVSDGASVRNLARNMQYN